MSENIGKIAITALALTSLAVGQPDPPASGAAVESLRRELAECRAECDRLRAENEQLRKDADGAQTLARFVEWLCRELYTESPTSTVQVMCVFDVGLADWAEGHKDRERFVGPSRKVLSKFLDKAQREAAGYEPPPIERSPARLRVELADMDRAVRAEIAAGYAGREIAWTGRVTGWEGGTLELVCDGVLVRAAVKQGGQGLRINDRASIRGVIGDMDGNPWVGVVVTVSAERAEKANYKQGGGL